MRIRAFGEELARDLPHLGLNMFAELQMGVVVCYVGCHWVVEGILWVRSYFREFCGCVWRLVSLCTVFPPVGHAVRANSHVEVCKASPYRAAHENVGGSIQSMPLTETRIRNQHDWQSCRFFAEYQPQSSRSKAYHLCQRA